MNKRRIIFLVIAIAIAAAFFIVPGTKKFNDAVTLFCPQEAVTRLMIDKTQWNKWWPGEKIDNHLFSYQGFKYHVNKIMLDAIDLTVSSNNDSLRGRLQISADTGSATKLQWISMQPKQQNGLRRLFSNDQVEKNISSLLQDLKVFFDKPEKLYGMKIELEKVKDSSLISTQQSFDHYPTTEEIYKMIDLLKDHISKQNGRQNDSPMLHVEVVSPTEFITMVAIPTVADLPPTKNIRSKKMVLGNILKGQIQGGHYSILEAEKQLKNFVLDFKRMSPAIPYQLLITNRRDEPDTSRWITGLYYPIF